MKKSDGHSLCKLCNNKRLKKYYSAPTSPLPLPSSPHLGLFNRPAGCIDPLSDIERAGIVILHKEGRTGKEVAHIINCSENTVYKWIRRWENIHLLCDSDRSGRPPSLSISMDDMIVNYADEKVNIVPKDIVRELELPVSARTVRRCLDDCGLHGRIKKKNISILLQHYVGV